MNPKIFGELGAIDGVGEEGRKTKKLKYSVMEETWGEDGAEDIDEEPEIVNCSPYCDIRGSKGLKVSTGRLMVWYGYSL